MPDTPSVSPLPRAARKSPPARRLPCALLALALASACAEDLEFAPYEEVEPESAIVTTDNGDGTHTTRVDAEDPEAWVYFDFQAQGEVTPEQPEADPSWDLAFQRFRIKINGGVSGPGGVRVAILTGMALDDMTLAPASGYVEDADDTEDDDDADPDYAFEREDGWYAYDPSSHTLSPRPKVYVVATADGEHFALELLGYYDEAGSDARPSFRWAPLPAAPSPTGTGS